MSQKFMLYTFHHLKQTFAHILHNQGKKSHTNNQHNKEGARALKSTGILSPALTKYLCCSGWQSKEETLKQEHTSGAVTLTPLATQGALQPGETLTLSHQHEAEREQSNLSDIPSCLPELLSQRQSRSTLDLFI